jgi:hypothetical protein
MNRAHVRSGGARSPRRHLANEYRGDIRTAVTGDPYFRESGYGHRAVAMATTPVDHRDHRRPRVAQGVRGPSPAGIRRLARSHTAGYALANWTSRRTGLARQNIGYFDATGASGPQILPECVSANDTVARTLHGQSTPAARAAIPVVQSDGLPVGIGGPRIEANRSDAASGRKSLQAPPRKWRSR